MNHEQKFEISCSNINILNDVFLSGLYIFYPPPTSWAFSHIVGGISVNTQCPNT